MRGRRRLVRTLGVAAAVSGLVLVGYAGQGSGSPDSGSTAPDPGSDSTVTLVTGDRVTVSSSGQRRSVQPGPGRRGMVFSVQRSAEHLYVIPSDAGPLVAEGTLDRRLFDVTELVRLGYDDVGRRDVPLIVSYGESREPLTIAGSNTTASLPAIDGSAIAVRKSQAGKGWAALRSAANDDRIEKVWLDGKVRASLDESVPQIGAPDAWDAGYTGKGATVAVLDSGIDDTHPDLADAVGKAKDFTSSPSGTKDKVGHGTHVASTITGSGQASDGRYEGVAPAAKLLNGKVLGDDGIGTESTVLAGMQWAAKDADVVNMSLGKYDQPGLDPVEKAVNTLTERTGTLFVVAAGNGGNDPETIDSPGSADAALTVGAVTKQGKLPEFSSRGPRIGDGAVKPDLTAPGVAITAARAKGTVLGKPAGEHYRTASGTSMATPHVAGAAALLAQQHPNWNGDELKAALMASAEPNPKAGVFDQGAGRVDLSGAITQTVLGDPVSVSFGAQEWPHGDDKPITKTVAYRNTGDQPVTLAVAVDVTGPDGKPAPDGMFTTSKEQLTVPANGTASVEVTADTSIRSPNGMYTGRVAASTDTQAVTTPIAVEKENESYDLTTRLIDRSGEPATSFYDSARVINLANGKEWDLTSGETDSLPPGRYAIHTLIYTPRPNTEPEATIMAHPEFRLDRDRELTFDAREAHSISVRTDQPMARGGSWGPEVMSQPEGVAYPYGTGWDLDPQFHTASVATVPGASSERFAFSNRYTLIEPPVELFTTGSDRFEAWAGWDETSPKPNGDWRLPTVYGGQGRPQDLEQIDPDGKLVVLSVPSDLQPDVLYERVRAIERAGGRMVAYDVRGDGAYPEGRPALPTLGLFGDSASRFVERVRERAPEVELTSRGASRYRYELAFPEYGSISPDQHHVVRNDELAAVRTRYHESPFDAPSGPAMFHMFGTDTASGLFFLDTMKAGVRTEYFSPGTWGIGVSGNCFDSGWETDLTLRAGQKYRISWGAAVKGPAFTELGENDGKPWVYRQGDRIDATLPLYTDAAGHTCVPDAEEEGWVAGQTSLYRNGELVDTVPNPARGAFDVPSGAADYRLTTNVRWAAAAHWWPLSTKVRSAWTFRSANQGSDPNALPLLAVRYAPDVDVHNRAPGGGRFEFPVTVERQGLANAPDVERLRLKVSYDDGETWRPVRLERTDDGWTAKVTHPGNGFASLRAHATDADGNTVEQTVIRAYEIAK